MDMQLDTSSVVSEQDLVQYLVRAQKLSSASISGFSVGAVALTSMNSIICGSNIEFLESGLEQTIHAEQSIFVQAVHQGLSIKKMAITHVPCGICRQTLSELCKWQDITIIVPKIIKCDLKSLYVHPFCSLDLGVSQSPPMHSKNEFLLPDDILWPQAIKELITTRFNNCYAPYSKSLGAVVLETLDNKIFGGSYIESAAYNTSISPVRAAVVELVHSGTSINAIKHAYCLHTNNTKVNHELTTRLVLQGINPDIEVSCVKI